MSKFIRFNNIPMSIGRKGHKKKPVNLYARGGFKLCNILKDFLTLHKKNYYLLKITKQYKNNCSIVTSLGHIEYSQCCHLALSNSSKVTEMRPFVPVNNKDILRLYTLIRMKFIYLFGKETIILTEYLDTNLNNTFINVVSTND